MIPIADTFGEEGLNGQTGPGSGGGAGGHFSSTNIDPHEIFNMFMNGGSSPFGQFNSMNGGTGRGSFMDIDNDFPAFSPFASGFGQSGFR